jgi:PAS domain-containing protein
VKGVHPWVLGALKRHAWPGNVRELRNVIESLVLFAKGSEISLEELPAEYRAPAQPPPAAASGAWQPRTMADIEKDAILRTLEFTLGERARAAKLLDIGLRTLQRKLKERQWARGTKTRTTTAAEHLSSHVSPRIPSPSQGEYTVGEGRDGDSGNVSLYCPPSMPRAPRRSWWRGSAGLLPARAVIMRGTRCSCRFAPRSASRTKPSGRMRSSSNADGDLEPVGVRAATGRRIFGGAVAVTCGVTQAGDLDDVLGDVWPTVLEHVSEAVLVLDRQRNLQFVNERARRLLGFIWQPVGSRCRLRRTASTASTPAR